MKYAIIKVLTWSLSYLDVFSAMQYKSQPEAFKLSWTGKSLTSNTKKCSEQNLELPFTS